MSELERYHSCMDQLRAPEALYSEVMKMTAEQTKRNYIPVKRTVLVLAAVLVLMLALGAAGYASGRSIFGWGGNFEVRVDEAGGTNAVLHTENLTEPVEFENNRMIFIVNGEHLDITESVSEDIPYIYKYTDEEGMIHYWLIGKNGPELRHYGYAEYLYQPDEEWIVGYSARTNLDPDNLPGWLTNGKEQLNIPW